MSRVIDADALKRKVQKEATESWKMKIKASVETILNQVIDWIDEAQTVEPEQKWIPVSSGLLPKAECGEGEDVLCQLENMRRIVLYFDGGNWCYPSGEPYIGVNYENGWSNKVVAWMPLPEPWKGGLDSASDFCPEHERH